VEVVTDVVNYLSTGSNVRLSCQNVELFAVRLVQCVDVLSKVGETSRQDNRVHSMSEVVILVALLAFGLIIVRLVFSQRDDRNRQNATTFSASGEDRAAILRDLLEGKPLDVPQFASAIILGFDRGMAIIALTDAKGHVTVVEWSEGFARRFLAKPKQGAERFSGSLLSKQ
jgi:hypothetical protein